jgi:hypothetical protein
MAGLQGTFTVAGPTRYVMVVPHCEVTFDLDRVRRERHELWGELIVKCDLKGAKTIAGVLAASDFNMSGQTSRGLRAKFLSERAQAKEIDWTGLVEEFCQRVITFDRQGADAPVLRDIPAPVKDDDWIVDGMTLLERHPAVLFGDGGQGKSLVALYLAGKLAQFGTRILYCDWEFDGESHRDRYGALFGEDMPESIRYARCDRPMVAESDRLRRLVEQYQTQYLVCDSIVFACAPGIPAESAEAAAGYFQALRQIGVGSLNLAHTTKQNGEKEDTRQQQKPFGSGFWHNGARATWFLKGVRERAGRLAVGVYPRKTNTGPLGPTVGWSIEFMDRRIEFRRTDIADHSELVAGLPIWQRMKYELRGGAQPMATLAKTLDVSLSAISQEAKRKDGLFTKVLGADGIARLGLLQPN